VGGDGSVLVPRFDVVAIVPGRPMTPSAPRCARDHPCRIAMLAPLATLATHTVAVAAAFRLPPRTHRRRNTQRAPSRVSKPGAPIRPNH